MYQHKMCALTYNKRKSKQASKWASGHCVELWFDWNIVGCAYDMLCCVMCVLLHIYDGGAAAVAAASYTAGRDIVSSD